MSLARYTSPHHINMPRAVVKLSDLAVIYVLAAEVGCVEMCFNLGVGGNSQPGGRFKAFNVN